MRTSIRPFVTTGVALVGASVIAVAPMAPPPDLEIRAASPEVALTALIPEDIAELLFAPYAALTAPLIAIVQSSTSPPSLALLPVAWLVNGVPPQDVLVGFASLNSVLALRIIGVAFEPLALLDPPFGGPDGVFGEIYGQLNDFGLQLFANVPLIPAHEAFPEGPLRDTAEGLLNINASFAATAAQVLQWARQSPAEIIPTVNAISEGADPRVALTALAALKVHQLFPDPDTGPPQSFLGLARALTDGLPAPIGGAGGVVDNTYRQFDGTFIAPIREALGPISALSRQANTSTQFSGPAVNEIPQGNDVVRMSVPEATGGDTEQPRKRPLLDLVRNSTKAIPGGTAASTNRPGGNLREAVRGVSTAVNDIRDGIRDGIKQVTNRLSGDRDEKPGDAAGPEPSTP